MDFRWNPPILSLGPHLGPHHSVAIHEIIGPSQQLGWADASGAFDEWLHAWSLVISGGWLAKGKDMEISEESIVGEKMFQYVPLCSMIFPIIILKYEFWIKPIIVALCSITHMIHVWCVYIRDWSWLGDFVGVNVGKYTSTMVRIWIILVGTVAHQIEWGPRHNRGWSE